MANMFKAIHGKAESLGIGCMSQGGGGDPRGRSYTMESRDGSVNLSARMTAKEAWLWLDGYEKAMARVFDARGESPTAMINSLETKLGMTLAALRAVAFQLDQGKVLPRDACAAQVRAVLATVKL